MAKSEPGDQTPLFSPPDWSEFNIQKGDNLPHWTCTQATYHVTLRLADAVPLAKHEEWRRERDDILHTARTLDRDLSEKEIKRLKHLFSEKIESYLDSGHGECLLAMPEIAAIVVNALRYFDGPRYRLHAWCIMPNHVHVIVEPAPGHPLAKITHSWTSFTSKEANKLLGRSGQLWQHEPYDHIIRSAEEYAFQIEYVWRNPDRAGISAPRWKIGVAEASGFGGTIRPGSGAE